jgi:peptidoglycan/xylan/chitin deacetylase (PgdA/CDA1 family)
MQHPYRCLGAAAVGVAATAAAAHTAPAFLPWSDTACRLLGVRRHLADPGAVALTFDDGPHPEGTTAVLDALRAAGVGATFFVVGEQVRRYPSVLGEVVAAGHDVALHCDRHRNMLRLTPREAWRDVLAAEDAIGSVTGTAPTCYRPPFGALSAAALLYARRRGWDTVLWSRWGRDWRADATPDSIARDAAADLRGAEVVLLHDADHYSVPGAWRATAASLSLVFEAVERAGLRVAPLA